MEYRILKNQNGKYKVQSRSHLFQSWHDTGTPFTADFRSLNWGGDVFDNLIDAENFRDARKAADEELQRGRIWQVIQ
jgi:hypothetical protein